MSSPSAASGPLEKPEFHQEFRLGLVVYGGVSLAIYMNGVCREFYNAVRGRGLYKLIKALTDADIVVDIISGTSAGGVNGVLLSYALANSDERAVVDFRDFASVWRDSGSISKLLRDPGQARKRQRSIESVLDGDGYYQSELANAFRAARRMPAPKDDWFSPFPELDLFVTGTDVLGKVYKAFDNTGQVIEVKDHRSVFLLKHREGRSTPFQGERETQSARERLDVFNQQEALAKLCRITSCFPVAFPVVTVKLDPASADREDQVDSYLLKWGQLDNRELPPIEQTADGHQLHFVDGGVLDNRPFSYTIRQIYYRMAYRPVDRKLYYIDPSPDRFLDSKSFKAMKRPSVWQAALDSLINLPRYESIANDLAEIKQRNEKVRRYKLLRATAENRALKSPPTSPQEVYLRCRLIGLRDRILPLILRMDRLANPDGQNKDQLLEKTAQLLTQYVSDAAERQEREDLLHELGHQIRNLDVDYALRKHIFFLEKIFQAMAVPAHESEYKKLTVLAEKISRQVALLEVTRNAVERLLKTESVHHSFNQLVAGDHGLMLAANLPNPTALSKEANVRQNYIYQYLFCLHRFLLDAQPDVLNAGNVKSFFDSLQPAIAIEEQLHPRTAADQWLLLNRDPARPQFPSVAQFQNLLLQRVRELDQPLDQVLQKLQMIFTSDCYREFRGENNDPEFYCSLLVAIEQKSEQLITTSQLHQSLTEELLNIFKRFRKVDQEVYAYEYLADIHEKDLIELTRISPDDAQMGLGNGKKQDRKLAGDQFRAFGGFFKKSWRSNDILWGRLDGLNRLVETLITADSLSNFPRLMQRLVAGSAAPLAPRQYFNQLLEEALPDNQPEENTAIFDQLIQLLAGRQWLDWLKRDGNVQEFQADPIAYLTRQQSALGQQIESLGLTETDAENQQIIDQLLRRMQTQIEDELEQTQFPNSSTAYPNLVQFADAFLDRSLKQFQDQLVTCGHRAILKDDLAYVLEDAIAEQFDWGQQLLPPQLGKLGYKRTGGRKQQTGEQLQALWELDNLVDRLLNPRARLKVTAYLLRKAASPKAASPADSQKALKSYLQEMLTRAFPNLEERDQQALLLALLPLVTAASLSIDDLYGFLKRLLAAGQRQTELGLEEVNRELQTLNHQVHQAIAQIEAIKPRYSPISGYLDQAITPFAVKQLARIPIHEMFQKGQIEDYFRHLYRVGEERLTENIPAIVLQSLAVRALLIVRDILASPPTGPRLRGQPIYEIPSRIVQILYWAVQRRSPQALQSTRKPRAITAAIALLGLLGLLGAVALLVSRLPVGVLVAIATLAIVWLLWALLGKIVMK